MKVIVAATGEVVGSIITNHSMTTEEALDLLGIEYVETFNESGYVFGGEVYEADDFDFVCEDDKKKG